MITWTGAVRLICISVVAPAAKSWWMQHAV